MVKILFHFQMLWISLDATGFERRFVSNLGPVECGVLTNFLKTVLNIKIQKFNDGKR